MILVRARDGTNKIIPGCGMKAATDPTVSLGFYEGRGSNTKYLLKGYINMSNYARLKFQRNFCHADVGMRHFPRIK